MVVQFDVRESANTIDQISGGAEKSLPVWASFDLKARVELPTSGKKFVVSAPWDFVLGGLGRLQNREVTLTGLTDLCASKTLSGSLERDLGTFTLSQFSESDGSPNFRLGVRHSDSPYLHIVFTRDNILVHDTRRFGNDESAPLAAAPEQKSAQIALAATNEYQKHSLFVPVRMLPQERWADFLDDVRRDLGLSQDVGKNEMTAHQDDGRTNRTTREFGYSFFRMEKGDNSFVAIPEYLQELGARVCAEFGHTKPAFTNIILSLYEGGFHLEPHVDVSDEDFPDPMPFYFGDRVYGLVLEADAEGHFYFVKHDDKLTPPPLDAASLLSIDENPGTIFCLEGTARRRPIHHAVSRVANRRISVTFRTVHFTSGGD